MTAPGRWWPVTAGVLVVASSTLASALALLPALLIGFVLLLRDVLGPSALPFGVLISVASWIWADSGERMAAFSALFRGFDSGLAAHLVRPVLLSACAMAPAAAILVPIGRLARGAAVMLRLLALGAAIVACVWGGELVRLCLAPGAGLFALRATQLSRRRAEGAPNRVAEGAPNRVTEGVPNRVAEGAPNRVAEGVPNRVAEGAPKQATEDASNRRS